MKTKMKIAALILMMMTGIGMPMQKASAQYGPASFQVFYDELSPYGDWVNDPNYGYVWIPYTDPGFMPYETNGYWVFTNYGWTWVSNYPWGWAPFHYGRWFFDPIYGAVWVPGYEWGPAWVVWRQSAGYYGWAPMAPGISINIAFGPNYNIPYDRWIFVRDRDFCRHDMYNYYVDRSRNTTIINNSTVINNTYIDNSRHTTYVSGPSREAVQRTYGQKIDPVAIRDDNRPGTRVEKGTLDIYRPVIEKTSGKGQAVAPRTVTTYDNSRAVIERKQNASKDNAKPAVERKQTTPAGNQSRPVYTRPQNNGTIQTREIKTGEGAQKNTGTVNETRVKTEQRQPAPVQKNNTVQPQKQPVQRNNTVQPQKQPVQNNSRPVNQKPQPQNTKQQAHPAQPAKSGKPTQEGDRK